MQEVQTKDKYFMSQMLWLRNSLRINDNKLLHALNRDAAVKAVYVLPGRWLQDSPWGFPKMGVHRARFLLQTLLELEKGLDSLNIPLYVLVGDPVQELSNFITDHGISKAVTTEEWLQEEREDLNAIKNSRKDIAWETRYDNFLFDPADLPYASLEELPRSFTPFRKRCEAKVEVRCPLPLPEAWPESNRRQTAAIPTLEDLGYDGYENDDKRTAFPFSGGYSAGMERIQSYFWDSGNLSSYKETRNGLVGTEYSSKLSPWLANGSLSPREVYKQVKSFEEDRVKNQSTYWLIFELIWREYFRYVSLKHGDRIFYRNGISDKEHPWKSDKVAREAWTQGETGNDFIDANMKELLHTGWMSNRGRQVVASYWAKDLGQDWRIGASWFESQLIDYDVHSNWGNWMYQAGVGNDPRDRRFNIEKQAANYDPEGRFRQLWLQDHQKPII